MVTVLQILIGLVGLGLVVFVHESGHLLAAKLLGIQVEAFSIGWGKKLVGVMFRGTEYRISLFPIGGYCKMKGEGEFQKAIEQNQPEIPRDTGSFYGAPAWRRIVVLLAGPAMNFLFAIVVLSLVWLAGFTEQTLGNRIVLQSEFPLGAPAASYPATEGGLETGDIITAINGTRVQTFRDIEEAVTPNPNTTLAVTVNRNGTTHSLTVVPALDRESGAGRIGVYAWIDPTVDKVTGAAQQAGVRPGDRITAVDGSAVANSIELQSLLSRDAGSTADVTLLRDGSELHVGIAVPAAGSQSSGVGLSFPTRTVHTPRLSIFGAVAKGTGETISTLVLTVKGIALLFQGVDFTQAVAGPIRITYMVGEVATQGFSTSVQMGFSSSFRFLSLLSVVLFFMNLLPVPALDGGQILLQLYDGLTHGRRLRPVHVQRYQFIGALFVLALIVFAVLSDILFFTRR